MSGEQQPGADGAPSESPSRHSGMMTIVRDRWAQLGSVQRLRAKQLGSVAAVGLVGMGLYVASNHHHADTPAANPPTKLDMGAGLRGDSLEEKLRGDLKKISDDQSTLGQRISAIEEGKIVIGSKPPGGEPGTNGDAEGAPLPPALPGSADYPPSPSASSGADSGQLPAPPSEPPVLPAPPAPPVEKIVGSIGDAVTPVAASSGDAGSADSKKKNRTIYLPPGFMKARLLTGIDALASRDATSNPEPIIARVQAPAVLPNDVKANLSGCFVIGNATGSLAKERVEIQLVSLSCVDFDQRSVVDQPVKGFFVDADGKKGLSGQVITRAGATLARAFLAGTISGIGQTVQDTFGSTSVSALGSVRTLSPTDAAKSGVAEGLSKSSDKLTDFYLDLAREAGPIVEVGAGKDVVVVIQEGVSLEIKPSAGVKF
jgi:conjugal transfer pilus assembly protein TraB